MRLPTSFSTCTFYWVVAACWCSVLLDVVYADVENKANASAWSGAFLHTLTRSRPLLERHQQEVGHEVELHLQVQEDPTPRDTAPASISEQAFSSCDDAPSFVQLDPETDVSCFPHDTDVGSTAPELKVVRVLTVQECLKECRRLERCTHYTFNKTNRQCHMKGDVPKLYNYPGDMTGPRSCDSGCLLGCMTYRAAPIRTLEYHGHSPLFCQAACQAVASCRVFTFDDGICKLYSSGFARSRKVAAKGVAGPREWCERWPDVRRAELADGHGLGSCLKSDNIGSSVTDMASLQTENALKCQQKCASRLDCSHYTYNTVTKHCYLKRGTPQYYWHVDDITGARDCVPT